MRARGPLVAGIVSGVVVLLLVVLVVLPKKSEVGKARDDVQTAQDQEVSFQAELRALQDAQASAPKTEEEIRALEDKVPSTVDLPGLFRLLQSAADRSAVDFFQFSPGTPVPDVTAAFSVVSSQIVITGNYFTLQEFLYNMETLPRAAKVMSVTVSPAAAATTEGTTVTTTVGRLQMQMTVEFYTTDSSAGPGSSPGATQGVPTAGVAVPATSTEAGA